VSHYTDSLYLALQTLTLGLLGFKLQIFHIDLAGQVTLYLLWLCALLRVISDFANLQEAEFWLFF
jgi:hypothetical protein